MKDRLKIHNIVSLAATGLLFLGLTVGTADFSLRSYAEDLLVEDVFEEDDAADVGGVPEAEIPENQAGGSGHKGGNRDPLIEGGDDAAISVSEGALFEDIVREEEEAYARELAAQKMQELLEKVIWMPEQASVQRLSDFLWALTGEKSPIGSDGELILARYIRQTMEEMGYDVEEQYFHEGILNADMVDPQGINLIAERGANSEERSDKILLIAAHYDSVSPVKVDIEAQAIDENAGSPENAGTTVDGNDVQEVLLNDKSGAAALMEAAYLLKDAKTDVDLCFLFLSGEEDGGYGAQAFAKMLKEDLRERICGIIVLDQAGYVYAEDLNTHPVYRLFNGMTEEAAASVKAAPAAQMVKGLVEAKASAHISYDGLVGELAEDYEAPIGMEDLDYQIEQVEETETKDTDEREEDTDWIFKTLKYGGGAYLKTLSADTVVISQRVYPEEEVVWKANPADEQDGVAIAESTDDTANTDGAADTENKSSKTWKLDIDELASCADVIAQTAALYMQSVDTTRL